MYLYRFLFLLVMMSLYQLVSAQQTLKGKVYEAFTDSILSAVNIFNTHTKNSVRSAADGSYSIAAAEGDIVIFSAGGFRTDTIVVSFSLLLTPFDLNLHRQVVSLKEVRVTGSYQADSLARRNYYSHIYAKQAGITGRNRPANGVGVTLSPVSFFSKESKQKRGLRSRLEKEEKGNYVDHSFPLPWVKNVTGLDGDSLSLFMYRYRPSYKFCRKTDRQGMLIYINDKVKEFRDPKSSR
ncbi:hypothetical protein [Terrimonas pollutisoli]|uniref:hypothetical protein n=1 Tax=Terrimonas pollutisoli TaxID=3034147 RepID=UPI0023ED4E22|nr:hypothetical protein [Terrimonas sp. H1YJ31]